MSMSNVTVKCGGVQRLKNILEIVTQEVGENNIGIVSKPERQDGGQWSESVWFRLVPTTFW